MAKCNLLMLKKVIDVVAEQSEMGAVAITQTAIVSWIKLVHSLSHSLNNTDYY